MPKQNNERMRDYDRIAKMFDQRLGLYSRQTIEETIQAARLGGKETILDACCGSGELLQLLALAEHTGAMIGVDFSEPILNVARHRLALYPNISLRQGDVSHLPLSENSIDVIFNTNAFHYLDGPQNVMAEFFRVLVPHGRLLFVDLVANSYLTIAWGWLRRLFRPGYYRLYHPKELQQIVERAGFVVTRRKFWRVNLFWSVMLIEGHKPAPSAK